VETNFADSALYVGPVAQEIAQREYVHVQPVDQLE